MFSKRISIIVASVAVAIIPQAMGLSMAPPKKFYGGAGVGRFTLDDGESWQCAYDMVLVERIQGKPKTAGGLFVPEEDMPRLHLCRGEIVLLQGLDAWHY